MTMLHKTLNKTLGKTLLLTGAVLCLSGGAFAQSGTYGSGNNADGSSSTINRSDDQPGNMNGNQMDQNRTMNDHRSTTSDRSGDSTRATGNNANSNRTMQNSGQNSGQNSRQNSQARDGMSGMSSDQAMTSGAMTQNQIRDVQSALVDRGYSLSVDGVWGNQTVTSLRRFQRENDLNETGALDRQTISALELDMNSTSNTNRGAGTSGSRY